MFTALDILKPTWYFNQCKNSKVWIDPESVDSSIYEKLKPCKKYTSEHGKKWDLSYQLLQLTPPTPSMTKMETPDPNPEDEYVFIARYFNKLWLFYFLLNRILRAGSPIRLIREFRGFVLAFSVSRFNWAQFPAHDRSYLKSVPLEDTNSPKVAVIIPTLNRHEYLEDALNDLYVQTYPNIEIIVVDQSDIVPEAFLAKHQPRTNYIIQKEKALWLARNHAIETTSAEYILLFDDDSRVDNDWVEMHMRALNQFDADISSGVSISTHGDKIPPNYSHFRLSDQLDTGNALVKREVFRKVGLFDRQFEKQRMGDGEFGLRSFRAGFVNISNPVARRIHLKVPSGGLRQHGHWDGWRPKKLFAPRPIPSVLYLSRKYWGTSRSLRYILLNVLPSVLPYRSKSKRWILIMYIPFLPILIIILLIQVTISWQRASNMLKEGDKIPELDR